ncbi:MAG: ribonuclease J [Armatimonadetes bacterium]|nr:ribonuclease J [Armatimonadota bacterium]
MSIRAPLPDAVRLISLGGMGDIGKNMTVLQQGDSLLVVDCGLMFPDEDHPGVDLILPDMTYLLENASGLVGVVLTHAHEDHMGALPYLLELVPARVYGTRLTLGLLEAKLQEFDPLPGSEFIQIEPGQTASVGPFHVEVVRVSHSIPDAVGLAVRTAAGTILFSGDFKFDYTPIRGPGADYQRLAQLGAEGVMCLVCDCTNVERPGHSPSERVVGENLRRIMREASGRVIVTTFASNVGRVQQIINQAIACERVVAITGRSMERIAATAARLGYLDMPEGSVVAIEEIDEFEPRQVVIVTTGSQGEPLSALARMSRRAHKQVRIVPGDTVVMSATPIPGNESLIWRTINRLFGLGAKVLYGTEEGVHASGHAYQDELRLMISLTRPRYAVPIHGDQRHLSLYRDLAVEMGMATDHIFLLGPGASLEFRQGKAYRGPNVPAGSVNVDGLGIGDVGDVVLSDRQLLSQEGIFLPVLVVDRTSGELLATPEIYSRGFVYMDEATELVRQVQDHLVSLAREYAATGERDFEALYALVRSSVSRLLYDLTERRPMVLPVIVPVGEEEAKAGRDSEPDATCPE